MSYWLDQQCFGTFDCNGNGQCNKTSGICICNANYSGDDCSQELESRDLKSEEISNLIDLDIWQKIKCPGNPECSGNGKCDQDTKICNCNQKFYGEACQCKLSYT